MPSVASEIRVDLIASAAKMQAGLREGSQALGDFSSQVEAYERKFASRKSIAERMAGELEAWRQAMQKEGSFLASAQKDFAPDAGLRGQMRRADLLPFGQSMRTAISREAAETAAAIGDGHTKVMEKLKEAAGEMAGESGLGSLLEFAGGVATNPFALAGGAAFGATELLGSKSDELRESARGAMRTSSLLGTNVEDASKLNAVGFDSDMALHFQKSMHERSGGFKDLGLDAEQLGAMPLTDALSKVGEALKHTTNPADRAAAAMELFGKSGGEVVPVLTSLKGKLDDLMEFEKVDIGQATRTRKYDDQVKLNQRTKDQFVDEQARNFGADEGFGTGWESFKGNIFAMGLMKDDREKYYEQQQKMRDAADKKAVQDQYAPQEAAMAADRKAAEEKAKKAAEETQKRHDEARRGIQQINDAGNDSETDWLNADVRGRKGNTSRNRQIAEHGRTLGWTPGQIQDEQEAMRQQDRRAEQLGRSWGLFTGHKDPMAQYREDQEAIAQWTKANGMRPDARGKTSIMNREAAEHLAAGLGIKNPLAEFNDSMANLLSARGTVGENKLQAAAADAADRMVAAVERPYMTAVERHAARADALNTAAGRGALTPEQLARRQEAETKNELGAMGIRRYQDEYRDQMKTLKQALGAGDITADEYARRERSLRKEMVGVATADIESMSPVAAMAAGSQAAYSLLVGDHDPKTQLQRDTNKILIDIRDTLKTPPLETPAEAGEPLHL